MKKVVIILVMTVMVLSACKKDKVGDTVYFNNGTVTGTLKGTKLDNSSIDEKFSFSQYLDVLDDQYYRSNYTSQKYEFNIEYTEKSGSTIDIEFELSSLTDITPEKVSCSFTYYKNIGNNIFHFHMYGYEGSSQNTTSISDFSFDKATGKTKGKITMTGVGNTTNKSATIEATFDVTLKEMMEQQDDVPIMFAT